MLLELEARRRQLAAEAEELDRARGRRRRAAEQARRAADEAPAAPAPRIDRCMLERLAAAAERLVAALAVDVDRFEAPLRTEADAGAHGRARRRAAPARRRRGRAARAPPARPPSASRRVDVELARIDAERDEATRRLEAAGAEPAEGDDRDELADTLERLERRREQLGQVNPLAREEYEAEKERLDELATQRADLERSLDELEQLRRDLTETVERRFEETFAAVEHHFAEVAATLFPGGEGRLRLTEPEDEDGRASRGSRSSCARPASASRGSRCSRAARRRSARSRSSSASSSPGRARSTSSTRSRRRSTTRTSAASRACCASTPTSAQFIVVTHQKRTMEAADVLYGVTMGGDGVSQLVSRRLPHDEEVAATA